MLWELMTIWLNLRVLYHYGKQPPGQNLRCLDTKIPHDRRLWQLCSRRRAANN